jgi:hypothetical protein
MSGHGMTHVLSGTTSALQRATGPDLIETAPPPTPKIRGAGVACGEAFRHYTKSPCKRTDVEV